MEKTHSDAASKPHSSQAAVIVLTRNAEAFLPTMFSSLRSLKHAPGKVLFVDSSSEDQTVELIVAAGYVLHPISLREFGHGSTRNLAARLCPEQQFLVYLTQDAAPQGDDWLVRLIAPFVSTSVALVYGRQLPRFDAAISERFAREFNYPAHPNRTTEADIARCGIKAIFCSNSFAAYRRVALADVNGFPEHLPMGEDIAVALRLLQRGHERVYAPDACAIHSHAYSVPQEFKRYFDIGALMSMDSQLSSARLAASREGVRFLRGELARAGGLLQPLAAINVLMRAVAKYVGFSCGQRYKILPLSWRRKMSMHSYFWRS